MDTQEFNKEKTLSYDDLVSYLLTKYGPAEYDYFHNSSCKGKNRKVKRTAEGLVCHHIFEKNYIKLSDPSCALEVPFEYQLAKNLVYCNYLEHFLLHIKIAFDYAETEIESGDRLLVKHKEGSFPRKINWDTRSAYYMHNMIPINGGMEYISSDINTFFDEAGSLADWQQRCFLEIKDNIDDYIGLHVEILQKAIDSFTGDKNYIFKEPHIGSIITSKVHGKGTITEIKNDPVLLREEYQNYHVEFEDGTSKNVPRMTFDRGNYKKCVENLIKTASYNSSNQVVPLIYDGIKERLIY